MTFRRPVPNNNGFSLIEMMIAVVFIMISMLALLTALTASIRANLENDVRNTAIRVSNQTAEALLALPFDDAELSDGTGHVRSAVSPAKDDQDKKGFPPTTQYVRSALQTYTIQWTVVSKTSNVKEVEITITYTLRSKTYSNTAAIYKHKNT